MGREYYAVNEETKKAYHLGKGPWEMLCSQETPMRITFSTPEELTKKIGEIIDLWEVGFSSRYQEEIAADLLRLGSNSLVLHHDSEWDYRDNWDVIGSRYLEDDGGIR